jgi:flagellar hook-basal body complex protein FliE
MSSFPLSCETSPRSCLLHAVAHHSNMQHFTESLKAEIEQLRGLLKAKEATLAAFEKQKAELHDIIAIMTEDTCAMATSSDDENPQCAD